VRTSTGTAALPPAPEPDHAPVPTTTPAGLVLPAGPVPEGIVITRSGLVAASERGRLLLLINDRTHRVLGTRSVPGTARHLRLAGPDGPLLLPGEDTDTVSVVSLPTGRVLSSEKVGRQPHDAVAAGPSADPTAILVDTDELGGSVTFLRTTGQGTVSRVTRPGPVQPGGLAGAAGRVGVVDVRGNSLWVYDPVTATLIATLPAGRGVTHAEQIGTGPLIVVADTRGGALLAFRLDGVPRRVGRLAIPAGPYGLGWDPVRQRLWVAESGRNLAVPVQVGTDGTMSVAGAGVTTVQQANSLAVDPVTGTLAIAGATRPGTVQLVDPPH
jgi:hypothetical protein